jgi:protein-disulfide isomerase-like protein with CxxC motif
VRASLHADDVSGFLKENAMVYWANKRTGGQWTDGEIAEAAAVPTNESAVMVQSLGNPSGPQFRIERNGDVYLVSTNEKIGKVKDGRIRFGA